MSKAIIERFYESFKKHDATGMVELYHSDVIFNDPVFHNLNFHKVKGMWEMLIERSGGELDITYHTLIADQEKGQCVWEAKYNFSKTKRPVHNIIHASMEFKDGLIIQHIDDFNFWRWSTQALGTPGTLLGWTPIIQNKVRKMASQSLAKYLSK